MKESDGTTYCTQTHLGNILKHGDSAVGYDIKSINCAEDLEMLPGQKSLPDVILVRKHYDEKYRKRKIWKQKRLDIEENEFGGKRKKYEQKKQMDLEEFEAELEQNKDYRKNVNLYRNDDAIKAKEARKKKKDAHKNGMQDENPEPKKEEDDEWVTDSEDYADENPEMIQLEELLNDMRLEEKNEDDLDRDIEDLLGDMDKIKVTKK